MYIVPFFDTIVCFYKIFRNVFSMHRMCTAALPSKATSANRIGAEYTGYTGNTIVKLEKYRENLHFRCILFERDK